MRGRLPAWATAPQHWRCFDALVSVAIAAAIAALIVVAGQKGIGEWVDEANYEIMFESIVDDGWLEILRTRPDPLYGLLSKLAIALGLSFSGFVFVVATITIAIKQRALRAATSDPTALFVLYLSYVFWLHEYTQIRAALAIALALHGIYIARTTRPIWFVAGALIHASVAVIGAGYYALRYPKLGFAAGCLGVIALALAIYFDYFDPFSIDRINIYVSLIDMDIFSEINLLAPMPILQGCILLCCLGLRHPLRSTGFMEYMFSGVGLVSFYALSFLPPVAFRFYELFLPFFLILLSRVWKRTPVLMFLTTLYFASGLKTTFIGAGSLLFPDGG